MGGGRWAVLLGLARLHPAMAQRCTVNQCVPLPEGCIPCARVTVRVCVCVCVYRWVARGDNECIDNAMTPLHAENALWTYRCPIAGGVAADFDAPSDQITQISAAGRYVPTQNVPGLLQSYCSHLRQGILAWSRYLFQTSSDTTRCATEGEKTAAAQSAAGCADACDAQALFRYHMSEISSSDSCVGSGSLPAPCMAFLWSEGSCTLYSSAISGDSVTPSEGTQYYRKTRVSSSLPNPGFQPDGLTRAAPGTCGCPSAELPDRCIVMCESNTCVRVPDEASVDGAVVLIKVGTGSCRGAGGPSDRAEEDLTVHQVDAPADCLALCTTADCFGVTIQTLPADQLRPDVCVTTSSPACDLANADQATCQSASTPESPCTYDAASRTCAATPDSACDGPTSAAACEAAGRCTFQSDPSERFFCEVWDKVEIKNGARIGTKVTVAEVASGEINEPIRPRNQAGDLGQCWLPQHVAHMCQVPASPDQSQVTTASLTNGGVMARCAADKLVPVGQQTCIECDPFFGPDPSTTDAVCNPKYGIGSAAWFEAGNVQCMPECRNLDDTIKCNDWASKQECTTSPGYMDANCALSCRVWAKPDAYCIEPMDPDEALLRCTPCPRLYYEGEPYECQSVSALDIPQCRQYGLSTTDACGDLSVPAPVCVCVCVSVCVCVCACSVHVTCTSIFAYKLYVRISHLCYAEQTRRNYCREATETMNDVARVYVENVPPPANNSLGHRSVLYWNSVLFCMPIKVLIPRSRRAGVTSHWAQRMQTHTVTAAKS